MNRIYVSGRVEPRALLKFIPVRRMVNGQFEATGGKEEHCICTPTRGDFAIWLRRGGYYQVAVNDFVQWLILVPVVPGTYALDPLIVVTYERPENESLPISGGRMGGPLILHGSPNEQSEPLQAATKEYVDKGISKVNEPWVWKQNESVQTVDIPHPLKRVPYVVTFTTLDGKSMYIPWKNLNEFAIRVSCTKTTTFIAYLK